MTSPIEFSTGEFRAKQVWKVLSLGITNQEENKGLVYNGLNGCRQRLLFARHIIQWKCNLCLQGTVLAVFLGSSSDISSSRRVKYSFIFCLPLQKHHNRVVRVSQVPSFLVITLFYCRHFSFIANSSVLRLGFSIPRTPTRDFKTSRLQLLRISLFSLFVFCEISEKEHLTCYISSRDSPLLLTSQIVFFRWGTFVRCQNYLKTKALGARLIIFSDSIF